MFNFCCSMLFYTLNICLKLVRLNSVIMVSNTEALLFLLYSTQPSCMADNTHYMSDLNKSVQHKRVPSHTTAFDSKESRTFGNKNKVRSPFMDS